MRNAILLGICSVLQRETRDIIGYLHCVAVCCSVSQCVAVCCGVRHAILWGICSVLQCVAVCCSVLQCVAA